MKIFLVILFSFLWMLNCYSQNFLEVKFSLNDINRQRENFVKEKVKSVTVKDKYSEKVYTVDTEGKIISESGKGESPYVITYNYENGNLVSFNGPFEHAFFEYDSNGNVKISNSDEVIYKYYYDKQNRITKEETDAEIETCPANKYKYDGTLVVQINYPCCEGNIAQRCDLKYDAIKRLTSVYWDEINCSNKKESPFLSEEYYYNADSLFPFKLERLTRGETEVLLFSYEYY